MSDIRAELIEALRWALQIIDLYDERCAKLDGAQMAHAVRSKAVRMSDIRELIEALRWALQIIDLYDERCAKLDGAQMAYPDDYVAAKESAKATLAKAEANQ